MLTKAKYRSLFDLSDLDQRVVEKFGNQLRCDEFLDDSGRGNMIIMDLSTEVLQRSAHWMSGQPLAKYEEALKNVQSFNRTKRWYQTSKQVCTKDLLEWTVEFVTDGPSPKFSGRNLEKYTWNFKGRDISAEYEAHEGGAICLTFYRDPASPSIEPAVYEFCRAYGEFLKDALTQAQRLNINPPKFNKYPF